MVEIKMGNTWFPLSRKQCTKSRKSYYVYGESGLKGIWGCFGYPSKNLDYWVIMVMLHS